MRETKHVTEQPWRGIVNEEWRRAKKLRGYWFKRVKKFKFKWDFKMNRNLHGTYYKSGTIYLNHRYIKQPEMLEEFRSTVRHEIAHIGTSKHGADFMRILQLLEGTRYAGQSFKRLK